MSARDAFSTLFQPAAIGSMMLKNRLVVPAMGTGFATPDGLVSQRMLDYYEARAAGGAGLVIVECACVDFPRGIHASSRLVIDNGATEPGLSALSAAIKKHGAKAAIQLNHAGRMAKPRVTGMQPVAPSPGADPDGGAPRELSVEEILRVVALFARAAERARACGFDGVELHAAHRYLIAQFCSPSTNRRSDAYGGTIENRARFLVQVLRAIRSAVGEEYPVWCRINAAEYGIEDGLTLDDGREIASIVDGLVDAVSVSVFGYGASSLANYPDDPGALVPLAAEIKRVVRVPVIAVGRLNAELGETAINEGHADLIALGRQSIADPDWASKLRGGEVEQIRPCIACFYCADAGLRMDSHVRCQVNAAVGRETECEIADAAVARKIAVVGGGPAGLEASRVLALRGHQVVLFEKEPRLGGLLNVGSAPPHKARLKPLVAYFENQMATLGVDVRLGTEANMDRIAEAGADAVIIATGSTPWIPPIRGVEGANVVTAADVLSGKAKAAKTVLVIGGGSTGCETAEFLFESGCDTTVIEMKPLLAGDAGANDRTRLLNRICALPIVFLTNAECRAITANGVVVRDANHGEKFIPGQTVVLALGMKPENRLFQELHSSGIETHMAGDCWHPGVIANAIADGSRLGRIL